jgi:FemAB-related protein (PEP-CTERM system-associated)
LTTITELTAETRPAWDAYVKNAAHGLPQHLSGWRTVLYQTHGYETRYLMALAGGQVAGVLPLFHIRSVLVGHTTMTMPGGLCADSVEMAGELIARGREIARQAKARRFVIQDTRQLWPLDLQTVNHHDHWMVDVRPDAEALWARLNGNIRRQVRIARRNQLTVEIDRTGQLLGAFYDVLSRYTHHRGTPVFGRNFLEHIIETFPDGFNIAVVFKERQPIGAYFQLQMGHTVYGTWGATMPQYLELRPVYLAYWEILRDTCARGYHLLDMGRSPAGSEASKYKGQWGGQVRPIYQQVASLGAARPADSMTHRVQADGKMQWVTRLWPKLPLPVTRYLGPKLRRHVPFA